MGGVFDDPPPEQSPGEVERPRQRPMEVDRTKYYETGRLAVGLDQRGLPVVGGETPLGPDEGWSKDNLICTKADGRPACEFYVALLTPADGVARGFGEMRQIRRFCRLMATAAELFEIDGNIYACSARKPNDSNADALLDDFETRQRDIAIEANETTGELDF